MCMRTYIHIYADRDIDASHQSRDAAESENERVSVALRCDGGHSRGTETAKGAPVLLRECGLHQGTSAGAGDAGKGVGGAGLCCP